MSTSFCRRLLLGGRDKPILDDFSLHIPARYECFLLAGGYVVNLVGERTNQTSRALLDWGIVVFAFASQRFFRWFIDQFRRILQCSSSWLQAIYWVSSLALVWQSLPLALRYGSLRASGPVSTKLPPPSSDQLLKAAQIVQQNLGGDEDE